ncbi:uncharacterized protein LOC129723808 isoform X2 [Wyeomyia smithii]|uniref:uncharacterized protein LOC129723808 isoform X2 n=1 Tax=Wyeomyia smithii TaxID=174621 RepID=UPI002467B169|nr:uncharacterized protein LOC129723808 isoform X2 [Wyeomyia smithii]
MTRNMVTAIIALCLLSSLHLTVCGQQERQVRYNTLEASEAQSEAAARGLIPHNGEQVSTRRFKRMYAMCPPHFFRVGNECYFISQNKQNWLDAHFECKDRNSKLAEPLKYGDRNLRKYLSMTREKNYIWIGGNYNWRANKWQWGYNGEEIGYQSFSQMVPGQDLKYHCAVLNPDLKFRWSAKLCTEKLNFICQHKMPLVSSNSRAKVYNRWNATFPNEMANEVEVVVADQPRNSQQKDYYSTVSNTTVSPTVLYNRYRNMKHSNRTLRIRPSRRRPNRKQQLLPKNDFISNDVFRRPTAGYVPDSEINLVNGNGHRNGNGAGPMQRRFNVDIHRGRSHKKHNHMNEVISQYLPHQHRHHLGETYTKPTTTATTTTPVTTITTTTEAPEILPTEADQTFFRNTYQAQQREISLEEKKARRDKVRERLAKLSPEEREQFFRERSKRKRSKQTRARNETIP